MAQRKLLAPDIRARKSEGPKIAAVTAYDATFARLLDEGGTDILLVGDSLGMVVQGRANTLAVTLEQIAYHGRAVARAAQRAHIVGDMPFMSYEVSAEQALASAGYLLKEGELEAVKIEGGREVAESVRRIVGAGIPVMGHVGLTPQSIQALGGFRVQGRGEAAAERMVDDAVAVAQAGAYCVVIEAVPRGLAERITQTIDVPTIGIGAGPGCDGQVLVCYDFLGMYTELQPKFVKRYAELGAAAVAATRAYVAEVQNGQFPSGEHTFFESASALPPRESAQAPPLEGRATGAGAERLAAPSGYGPVDGALDDEAPE